MRRLPRGPGEKNYISPSQNSGRPSFRWVEGLLGAHRGPPEGSLGISSSGKQCDRSMESGPGTCGGLVILLSAKKNSF